jgi:hypothetical protein
MGIGDNLMATGMARGAAARGKRIAFGDGKAIRWDAHSELVFRGNPNVARPGSEGAADLEWIDHYKGHRLYNRADGKRWVWNLDFRATPGEMFFSDAELQFASKIADGLVIIEPNVPAFKSCAPNKQWAHSRFDSLSRRLTKAGHRVAQFVYPGAAHRLTASAPLSAPDFRHALAVLARAKLYVGPEGGLHHGSAAVGIPAVVLFGGFIPPAVTGYATHTNLTGGATACGSLRRCQHCQAAMEAISVDEVYAAAVDRLNG